MDSNFIFWALIAGVIYWYYIKAHEDEQGRIDDRSVTVDRVVECLDSFKINNKTDAPNDYTEAFIQRQLFIHLNKTFVHVKREQGLEGINGLKIDFDIGRGEVGVEVKLAKSLFRTSSLHRLVGQLDDYKESKYDDNLIVAVFGTKAEESERAIMSNIKDKIDDKATFVFVRI